MSIAQIDQIVRRYFDPLDDRYNDDDDLARDDHAAIWFAATAVQGDGGWAHTGAVWDLIRARLDAINQHDQQQIESLYDQIAAILHPETAGQR